MIGSVGHGAGVTIRLNPTTGKPALAYFDRGNNTVYYAPCSGTIATCATSGWSPAVVDNTAGVNGLVSGNDQLLSAAIGFTSSAGPYVFFPRGAGATGHLSVGDGTSGTFNVSTLYSGANGAISGVTAVNFAVSGWNVVSTSNAAGGITTAYIGPGNRLYSTSCGD